MASTSPITLEAYAELHAALIKGSGTVQPVSVLEEKLYRLSDLRQVRLVCCVCVCMSAARGSKRRRDALHDEQPQTQTKQ